MKNPLSVHDPEWEALSEDEVVAMNQWLERQGALSLGYVVAVRLLPAMRMDVQYLADSAGQPTGDPEAIQVVDRDVLTTWRQMPMLEGPPRCWP